MKILTAQHDPRMYSDSGYWFKSKHGMGPGTIPHDCKVLDWCEPNNYDTFLKLDRFLTTSELNDYELKELTPPAGSETHNGDIIESCSNVYSDSEIEEEDNLDIGEQEYSSADTSINSGKLPAVFNMINFKSGSINLDYGGGKFDNAAAYLAEKYDATNLVYDPYNRTAKHNSEVIKEIRANDGADTATCSNVLNVIQEESARIKVLENIKKLVKPSGEVYITVYEGNGSGQGKVTQNNKSYQLNKKTADYLEEIQSVFPDATRKGKLIIAHPNGKAVNSATKLSHKTTSADSENLLNDLKDAIYNYALSQGWESDEVWDYHGVDVSKNSDNGLFEINVWAETDFEGLDNLATVLNPIVEKIDKEAYFEPEDLGRLVCYIQLPQNVDSTTDVTASSNNTYEEEIDTTAHQYIYLSDVEIIVDADGDIEDIKNLDAANSEDDYKYGVTDEGYTLRVAWDRVDAEEKLQDMLQAYLPMTPGNYIINGTADLVYDVYDLQVTSTYEPEYGGGYGVDIDIDDDHADIDWSISDSTIDNFSYTFEA